MTRIILLDILSKPWAISTQLKIVVTDVDWIQLVPILSTRPEVVIVFWNLTLLENEKKLDPLLDLLHAQVLSNLS